MILDFSFLFYFWFESDNKMKIKMQCKYFCKVSEIHVLCLEEMF